MCQFYEVYNGSYLRYRSVVDGTRYIGFNKFGKPMKNPHGRQECFNFIKYNPHADIKHHNSLVNAEMGGMEPRESYVVSRKPSPVMRATKNSLLRSESAREHAHTSTHRHRHSNRWKMRQDGADSGPRRRHESRLVEASKYWAACELADQDCLLHYPVRTWDQTAKHAGGPLVVGMSGAHLKENKKKNKKKQKQKHLGASWVATRSTTFEFGRRIESVDTRLASPRCERAHI